MFLEDLGHRSLVGLRERLPSKACFGWNVELAPRVRSLGISAVPLPLDGSTPRRQNSSGASSVTNIRGKRQWDLYRSTRLLVIVMFLSFVVPSSSKHPQKGLEARTFAFFGGLCAQHGCYLLKSGARVSYWHTHSESSLSVDGSAFECCAPPPEWLFDSFLSLRSVETVRNCLHSFGRGWF